MVCGGLFFADLSIYQGWFKNVSIELIKWVSIILVGVLILFRRLLNQALGSIIKEKTATEDLFFQYAFGIYISALVMLVCCLLLHYSNIPPAYLFLVGISVLGLIYGIRAVKIMVFGYTVYGFSPFHLVLYLCAVEIIPLAVFVKVIVNS